MRGGGAGEAVEGDGLQEAVRSSRSASSGLPFRRDLYEIRLVALFLDATFIAVRPDGPREGVQVAWGFTEDGERVLLAVSLGMRESFEDSADARARSDQPRAGRADADRRRRRARPDQGDRAVLAGVGPPAVLGCPPRGTSTPSSRTASANASRRRTGRPWMRRSANRTPNAGCRRWSTTSTRADSPPPPAASPTTSTRSRCTCDTRSATAAAGGHEPARALARRGQTPHQGDGPLPRRDQLGSPWSGPCSTC